MDQQQRELTVEQCLEQANLCRILAQQVTSPQHGEMLDQIAEIWERMADDIHGRLAD